MIIRMIGAVLVIAGGAYAGCVCAARLRKSAELPADFITALTIMRAEITLKLTPMPDIFTLLASRAGMSGAAFDEMSKRIRRIDAEGLAYIWTKGIETYKSELGCEAYSVLAELGDVLGRYDAQECAKCIDYTLGRLEAQRAIAQERYANDGRLRRRLGVMLGAAAAILLL